MRRFVFEKMRLWVVTVSAFFAVFLFLSRSVMGDSSDEDALSSADKAVLASVVGNDDAAVLRRVVRKLGAEKLISAFYQGSRSERLAALDAAAYVEAPGDILPFLVALTAASDRQTAARAAASFISIMYDARLDVRAAEMIPAQAAQLISQLTPIARNGRLDADIRVAAAFGIGRLADRAKMTDFSWSLPLFDDADAMIRRMAVGMQRVPLADDILLKAAEAVGDSDPAVRGISATLLCENALSHGVKEPSDDLTEVLKKVVQDAEIPADMLAGVFVCLNRFSSARDRRHAIIDAAASNENPDVAELLTTLKLR